jgi:hypothetical protein
VSAKIQNLEKTIRRIDDALQNDPEPERTLRAPSERIQYDKISVFPVKKGLPDYRMSPRPFPRSSSFFADRAKSVVPPIAPVSPGPEKSFAERACSAPPAPPRLQPFSTRYSSLQARWLLQSTLYCQ